ncbi:MAG TPA: hypothetical protein VID94_12430 [Acidimicrobiales bacterium]
MATKFLRWIGLLLVGLLAFVAVGCGGDEEGSDAVDEDQFVSAFDEICLAVSADLDALDTPENNDELAEQANQAIDIASDGLDDMAALTPPADLADEFDDLIQVLSDRIDLFTELQQAAEDDDDDAINDLADENADLETQADELGAAMGLDCFADSGDSSDDFSDSSDSFSDSSSDFSSDFSSDLSSDFSDDIALGESVDPSDFIPEYGTDPQFDALADNCFSGDLASCDQLYAQTPISDLSNSYEGYGATCGGRLSEERPGQCVELG